MLKDFLWEVFENSGSIEAYIFYKELIEHNYVENENFTIKDEVTLIS